MPESVHENLLTLPQKLRQLKLPHLLLLSLIILALTAQILLIVKPHRPEHSVLGHSTAPTHP